MKETHFKWLVDSCSSRKGKKLKTGEVYAVSDFPEHVVAEWVKTKAAAYVKEKSKKEETE